MAQGLRFHLDEDRLAWLQPFSLTASGRIATEWGGWKSHLLIYWKRKHYKSPINCGVGGFRIAKTALFSIRWRGWTNSGGLPASPEFPFWTRNWESESLQIFMDSNSHQPHSMSAVREDRTRSPTISGGSQALYSCSSRNVFKKQTLKKQNDSHSPSFQRDSASLDMVVLRAQPGVSFLNRFS